MKIHIMPDVVIPGLIRDGNRRGSQNTVIRIPGCQTRIKLVNAAPAVISLPRYLFFARKMSQIVIKTTNLDAMKAEISVEEQTIPEPSEGQVVIKMSLRPVNPVDIYTLKGLYPGAPFFEGQVPGVEGCGTVERVGAGVKISVGQRVALLANPGKKGQGAWATYVIATESSLVPVSDKVDDASAAMFFVETMCVYGLLKTLNAPKGAWLIQTAANSVVGRQFIQMAKHWGYRTINVVRRKELEAELKELGADVVIDSTTEDVVARVKEVTGGEMAYGGTECVMGSMTAAIGSSLRNRGQMLMYGALASIQFTMNVPDVTFRNVEPKGYYTMVYLHSMPEEERQKAYAEALSMLEEKIVTPYTGKVFPLAQVKEAVEEAIKPGRGGKAFLSS